MPRVIVSENAQSDLKRLYQFLASKNRSAAQRAIRTIRQAFKPLREQPEIGRPIEDESGLREIVIEFGASGYLALYHYEPGDDQAVILTIRHQREQQYSQPDNEDQENK